MDAFQILRNPEKNFDAINSMFEAVFGIFIFLYDYHDGAL